MKKLLQQVNHTHQKHIKLMRPLRDTFLNSADHISNGLLETVIDGTGHQAVPNIQFFYTRNSGDSDNVFIGEAMARKYAQSLIRCVSGRLPDFV